MTDLQCPECLDVYQPGDHPLDDVGRPICATCRHQLNRVRGGLDE